MTVTVSIDPDSTAPSPSQLKAEIIRIRRQFSRPLPPT